MAERPQLYALAARFGILPAYVDQSGSQRSTPDATRVALLAALGVDASSEAAAQRALQQDRAAAERRLLAPVHVRAAPRVARVHLGVLAAPGRGTVEWEGELAEEGGRVRRWHGRARPQAGAAAVTMRLPPALPHGYHRLRVTAIREGEVAIGEQALIVTPRRCLAPSDLLGRRHQVFGLLANLYTLRSRRNWGVGDLRDLRDLVAWSGTIGAAFVGVNPLHALANRNTHVSPYSPLSRLYRNVLYLDVTAVPELAHSPAVRERLAAPGFQKTLAALRARADVAYEQVVDLKLEALRALHRTFVQMHRQADTARGRSYRRYREREGEALLDLATFLTLDAHWRRRLGASGPHEWPAPYRQPRSPQVAQFRRAHHEEVDLYCYLQFELDRQLAVVAAAARRRAVPLGVYQDLALGTAPEGSDPWAFPDLFLDGVRIGAPPDDYNAAGQNWNLPPLDPRRLAETGYAYFARIVRGGLRHAGALRVDHVMGLLRQYWIPDGFPATAGAYVSFPADDLFGILALESTRAGALVVGEDLGTVPPELPQMLARWGVLSTRVLYFERTARGGYRPARTYPKKALVSANTHDLAPLAGFWSGRDVDLRSRLGLIGTETELQRAHAERASDRRALARRLAQDGALRDRKEASSPPTAAIHAFLAQTPAALVGLSLDDLAREIEPVNVPGVTMDRHPSWSRRMTRSLEALRNDPEVRRALKGVRRRRWKAAR